MSLARPEIASLTGKNERIVIVLDTSPTMNTQTGAGKTRWQRAVQEAKGLLDSGGPTTEFRVIDTSGATASAFTTDRNEVRRLIDQMSPKTSDPQFPKVDGRDAQVYFVSDGVTHSQHAFFRQEASRFSRPRTMSALRPSRSARSLPPRWAMRRIWKFKTSDSRRKSESR